MNEKLTAIMNDQRLMDIAKYKRTSGLLKTATPEELTKEFTALKKRILSGRTTISKLEEAIFGKFGVQEDVGMPMSNDSMGFMPPPPRGPDNGPAKKKKQIGFGTKY